MKSWLLNSRAVRVLVIAWYQAPFGWAFFPWFLRLVMMPVHVRLISWMTPDKIVAGMHVAEVMANVYGARAVLAIALQYVEVKDGRIEGAPFDVGVALWALSNQPESR